MEFVRICCPNCGKWLFDAAKSASGTIKAYCKVCREPKSVTLKGKA